MFGITVYLMLSLLSVDLTSSEMDACNHWTFSQAIIQSVTDVGIVIGEVIAVVVGAATARMHTYHE